MSMIAFSREKTQMLKGVALLLMLVHHTAVPELWADDGSALHMVLTHVVASTKMCVYIFAFLVGYGFFCSANKSWRYSLRRIALLLVPFWTMMTVLFLPSAMATQAHSGTGSYALIGGVISTPLELVYNYFGISESLNWYSWFVCFYILSILALPFLHRHVFSRLPKWGWLATILLCYIAEIAIHSIPNWDKMPLIQNLFIFFSTFPLIAVGYQCGKWNRDGRVPQWFEVRKKLALALGAVAAVMLVKAFNFNTFGFCIQAFYTPVLVFALVGIFNSYELPRVKRFLVKVGDLSMYMWFFHAIFFTTTVNAFSRYLVFEPIHNYFYTLLITFVLTYAGSWLFKRMLTPILNRIK